jgi:hypothetical protein
MTMSLAAWASNPKAQHILPVALASDNLASLDLEKPAKEIRKALDFVVPAA